MYENNYLPIDEDVMTCPTFVSHPDETGTISQVLNIGLMFTVQLMMIQVRLVRERKFLLTVVINLKEFIYTLMW